MVFGKPDNSIIYHVLPRFSWWSLGMFPGGHFQATPNCTEPENGLQWFPQRSAFSAYNPELNCISNFRFMFHRRIKRFPKGCVLSAYNPQLPNYRNCISNNRFCHQFRMVSPSPIFLVHTTHTPITLKGMSKNRVFFHLGKFKWFPQGSSSCMQPTTI